MQKQFAFIAMLALAVPAEARAGVFYNNQDDFSLEHPRAAMARAWLVRIKPGVKASFYWNAVKPKCPALRAACKARGYLVPGDIAVAAYTIGSFTIVDFVGPNGAVTDGAIESRLLERIETPKPTPQDWTGDWQDTDEQNIEISQTSDPSVLAFLGNALWGTHDPERVRNGGVHVGSFAAYVRPAGEWGGFTADLGGEGEADFKFPEIAAQKDLSSDWAHRFPLPADNADGVCRASFRLLGPYRIAYTPLFVCGGMNVTFTGVFRRNASHHR